MKKIYVLPFILSALLCSCISNPNNDLNIFSYNDTINIEHYENENKPIYDGFEYGRVIGVQYEDHIENNLIQQCNSYSSALLMGDLVSCKKYMYPGVYSYYKQFFPYISKDEMYDEFLKTLSDNYASTLQTLSQQGIDFEIVVAKLLNKIAYKDHLFIVFEISSNVYNKNVVMHPIHFDRTLGISNNGGTNWYIIAVNEDTPHILSKFPQQVINTIMGY